MTLIARTKKVPLTYAEKIAKFDEEIKAIDDEIIELNDKVKALRASRKIKEAEKSATEQAAILDTSKEADVLTPDEIMAAIKAAAAKKRKATETA